MTNSQTEMDDLALYVHWPYCARICPYCDFNVYKQKRDDGLLGAILTDMAHWRELSGPRNLTSIHFGGGTPSLMSAPQVSRLIEAARRHWNFARDIEIAIEGNPADADQARWQDYRGAGITRMSLGVQSFDNAVLSRLGRDHDGAQATKAAETAREIFPSISLDLIFGHAGQTQTDWADDLSRAIALSPDHISAYQLTIEDGTAFARAESRGQARAVDDEASFNLYGQAKRLLGAAGYHHYEVSNYARPGHSSKHNLAYWRGVDYAGIGPGAHGRITRGGVRYATVAAMRPEVYTQSVHDTATGIEQQEALSPTDWAEEYVMMGLRIDEGLSLSRYVDIAGQALPPQALARMVDLGLLRQEGERIFATDNGRTVLNSVSAKLLGA